MTMHVKFWGTRGSLPRPQTRAQIESRIRAVLNAARPEDVACRAGVDAFIQGGCRGALPTIYGGNTPCVQVHEEGGPSLLLDFGTGARDYAVHAQRTDGPVAKTPYHVLVSHLHWDHLMGFPFFSPAYVAGNEINIYACHEGVEEAFVRQHGPPSFPVPFKALAADIRFHVIAPDRTVEINGFEVTPHALNHPGRAFGYRIERSGRAVVYATDAEHKPEKICSEYPYVGWIRGADVLIFDAQYSQSEYTSVKEDWGHSSNVVGVELALLGGVGHLVLFHHEPLNDDERLDQVVQEARRIEETMRRNRPPVRISGGWDGLDLEI